MHGRETYFIIMRIFLNDANKAICLVRKRCMVPFMSCWWCIAGCITYHHWVLRAYRYHSTNWWHECLTRSSDVAATETRFLLIYLYIHSIIVTSRGCTFKFHRTRYLLTSHATQTINNATLCILYWSALPFHWSTVYLRILNLSNAVPVFILPVERVAIQCKDLANKF